MSVTKGVLASLLFATTEGVAFTGPDNASVIDCIAQDNAKYCLGASSLLDTACCDTTADYSTVVGGEAFANCEWAATQEKMCTTNAKPVMNKFLREFLFPYNAAKCPSAASYKQTVTETGKAGIKYLVDATNGYTMKEQMPPADGKDWHCKFEVVTDDVALQSSGYLYFAAEQYCFGRWVVINVQPKNKYVDFNPQSLTNDPAEMSKVFVSQFGTRYLIPAEYDVYIEFSPAKGDPNLNAEAQAACNEGAFKFWVQHVTNADALALSQSTETPYANVAEASDAVKATKLGDLISYTPRLEVLASGETAKTVVPLTDESTKEASSEVFANADKLPDISVSSDGTTPAWYSTIYNDKVLFNVAGQDISQEEVVQASFAVLIIILICVAICMAVSFWKRKRIAQEARRASNYVRRSTATLRASIRRARGKPTPEEEAKPMTDSEIKKNADAGGDNKQEKAMLKDMMVANNEGGSIEMNQVGAV